MKRKELALSLVGHLFYSPLKIYSYVGSNPLVEKLIARIYTTNVLFALI
jgi:hypothetical protein